MGNHYRTRRTRAKEKMVIKAGPDRTHSRLTSFVPCALCFVLLLGCGNSDLPQTVPVQGRVTFAGGDCPGPGTVHFAPLEASEGFSRRPGRADFDTDGRFTVRSFGDSDGLVPGRYRTRVECWKEAPANGKPGVSYLPDDFETPELVIRSDTRGPIEVTYDVPAA